MGDGVVRLFNLLRDGNAWPEDRWGHELGVVEGQRIHVEVADDGQHVRRANTRE